MAKYLVSLASVLAIAVIVIAEPPAEYGAPSYGAPSSGYGGGSSGYSGGSSGYSGGSSGYSGGESSGGWSDEGSSGGGGGGGWGPSLQIFKPKFRYINLRIPIPVLPRIRFGLGAKIKASASIQQPSGW